jgi:peptide/nickel transport system substrate-binding protein
VAGIKPIAQATACWCSALAFLAICAAGCARREPAPSEAARRGYVTVAHETQSAWTRNFNPFLATSRAPTRSGIYEPLIVYNVVKNEWAYFLAERYEFLRENRVLRFELRRGVHWSDGVPFTAKDVVFTFELLKKFSALDRLGVRKFLHRFGARGEYGVEFEFERPSLSALPFIGHQSIVPAHVWRHVADPLRFMNETPVATGPFTEVEVFRPQLYELGKNPHYWQEGKPYVNGLRYPAFGTNEGATLALLEGDVDWAGLFVPAVDRVFVARDPEHHHRWFPPIGGTVLLYANTTRKPFDDVRVRKALSQAIDRELIVKVAMFNYTRPSDASGLSDAYASWRAKEHSGGEWVRFAPARAEALLDEAGYRRGAAGQRVRPDGSPLEYDLNVVDGWSDWVRACQIIARSLTKIGIVTKVKQYSWGAFYDKIARGDFDLSIGWSFVGPTPVDFYVHAMARHTKKPLGESSDRNWHRYHAEGMDELLEAFDRADLTEQHRLAIELQRLFVEHAPVIPLFPGPECGEYNDRHFTGFPDEKNPYGPLASYVEPGNLLVMTEIRPRAGSRPAANAR